jgi:DNA-binding CsgD family transcriptional regulator
MKDMNTHNRGPQRVLGFISSLAMLGFASSESVESGESCLVLFDEPAAFPLAALYLLFAALFLVTALFVSLGTIQVGLFFLLSALQATRSSGRLYALGFAIVAAILLLRRGWFFRKPMVKAVLVGGVGCATFLGPLFASGQSASVLMPALIGSSVFVIVVLGMARGRFLSAFAPKKRVLRLADFKLTSRESLIVKMRIAGKSVKEIALENHVADSTVRNALAFSYRKLGIEGGDALMAIGERYTVE